jgi:hypothetical protein
MSQSSGSAYSSTPLSGPDSKSTLFRAFIVTQGQPSSVPLLSILDWGWKTTLFGKLLSRVMAPAWES